MWRVTSLHPSLQEETKWPLEQLWSSGGLSFPATAIYLHTALIPSLINERDIVQEGGAVKEVPTEKQSRGPSETEGKLREKKRRIRFIFSVPSE